MKLKYISIFILFLLVSSCIGTSSSGVFGTGVSVAFDPRSIGTQIDDSIMQKNLSARLALNEKSYLISINIKVIDGRIFITGKVDEPEEKLQITKLAWETKGARSVKNDIKIKEKFNDKILVITDLCFCEYTDHGHCGIINPKLKTVDNSATLEISAKQAIIHAKAGADMIAPSGMTDDIIITLREALDKEGFSHIPIMSYSTKFASSF